MLAGLDDELAAGPELAFPAGQGVLVQQCGGLVAVHGPDAAQAQAGQMFVEGLRGVR